MTVIQMLVALTTMAVMIVHVTLTRDLLRVKRPVNVSINVKRLPTHLVEKMLRYQAISNSLMPLHVRRMKFASQVMTGPGFPNAPVKPHLVMKFEMTSA